jgi:hypothetical protein
LLSAAGLLLQSAGGFLSLSAAASSGGTAAFEDSMLADAFEDSMLADAAGVTLTAEDCTVEVVASLPLGLADFLPLRTVLA